MSKELLDNVYRMSNAELIGLAKNRFLPEDMQLAIAKKGYRRGQAYLCENPGLKPRVRDYLWSDDCNRGFTMKCDLIMHGHYMSQPEKYIELYEKHGKRIFSQSPWRAQQTFYGRHWYGRNGPQGCPSQLLTRIYDDFYSPRSGYVDTGWRSGYPLEHNLRSFLSHANCDLPLAIRISTCGIAKIESMAFDKIVELSK